MKNRKKAKKIVEEMKNPRKVNKRKPKASSITVQDKSSKLQTKKTLDQNNGKVVNKPLKKGKQTNISIKREELTMGADEFKSESNESTGSEYSLDEDPEFFLKPKVFVCDGTEKSSLELDYYIEEDSPPPWLLNTEEIDGKVTKILVFEETINELDTAAELDTSEPKNEMETEAIEDNPEEELMENEENNKAEATKIEELEQDIEMDNFANVSPDNGELLPELSIFVNSLKTNQVIGLLKQDMELYGTVSVSLLFGCIAINGYTTRSKDKLDIYSPKGFNWVVISPCSSKKPPKSKLNWGVLSESFSNAQLKSIEENYDPLKDAIVLLQRNSGAHSMLSTFAKHMAQNVFPLLNATNRPFYASEYLLNCLLQSSDGRRALQVPPVWNKLALQQDSRVMVTGGKGVGKSTLLRYLINRHHRSWPKILLIDLDIGQPEIFVAQTISCTVIDEPLLGPGFFQNKQPELAYVVGHVNVVMCAEQYALAVRNLLDYCRKQDRYKKMPWLINTMGYNKGFGLELMALIVDAVQPTDVVQIESSRPINNFDESLDAKTLPKVQSIIYVAEEFKLSATFPKYKLHQLRSVVPQLDRHTKGWQMSAKDVRYSNLLTRLSAALRDGDAKHLTDCTPVQVNLDDLQIVHLTSAEYSREELIAGMEANLVYLCKGSAAREQPVECLGIGIVRAIDYEAKKLYLVPAMPLSRLAKVNCLVLGGDLCLPQGFFKDQGPGVANNVPFVFIIDDSKSSRSIQQIYFRAPGFLGNPANKKPLNV